MVAPLFILVADIALWFLWKETWSYGDDLLSLITFSLALSFLIWFLIEIIQLAMSFTPSELEERS